MSLGILGPPGTFSETAAIAYGWPKEELVYADSILSLFHNLCQGEVTDILVPFENSAAGILRNSLLGLTQFPVMIKGEVTVPVKQCLMGAHPYDPAEIEVVVTQPAVLAQCENYLRRNLPGVRIEITESTARAAQMAAADLRKAAAIGPEQAAENYGLVVIARDIQQENNCTRFFHLSQAAKLPGNAGNKSSIIFELDDRPGALYKALEVFALQQLNLTQIESFPVRRKAGYRFYVEVDLPINQLPVTDLLAELESRCTAVLYLGSYYRCREVIAC